MNKFFRVHRGSFEESLASTIEVMGLRDMSDRIKLIIPSAYNVRIAKGTHKDDRLPKEWGGYSFIVLADFGGYSGQCVGWCNFYEE